MPLYSNMFSPVTAVHSVDKLGGGKMRTSFIWMGSYKNGDSRDCPSAVGPFTPPASQSPHFLSCLSSCAKPSKLEIRCL